MTKLRLPLRPLKSHAADETVERVWERIERTRVRHRRGRQALQLLVPLAAAVLLYVALDRPATIERKEIGSSSLALSDRSKVRVEEGSRVRVAGNSAQEVRLVLEEGRADFDVDPTEGKRWSIDCGLITVEVVGTRFSIVRAGDQVDVTVERGVVRVVNDRIDRLLIAGDRFHTEEPTPVEATPEEERPPRAERRRVLERAPAAPKPAEPQPPAEPAKPPDPAEPPPEPTFDELMDKADRARTEGRDEEAIALLELAIERSDPRAGIAAFTLGRLRSEQGAHRRAAAAFERALSLGVPTALLEGAMSRAFEAHDDAGDRDAAKRAASRYLDRFPHGRQAAAAQEVLAR